MKNTQNNKSRGKAHSKPNRGDGPSKDRGAGRNAGKQQNKQHGNAQDRNKSRGQAPKQNKTKIDLFGMHAVSEAWINPKRHIHNLYITDKALDGFDRALKTAQSMGLKRPTPEIIEKSMLDGSTPMGSVHQGIALNCQNLDETDIHDFIRMSETRERSVLVMLDQVTDPHNVGAIVRSACVFGAAGIIMQKKHAPELLGVLAKTACGGVEHVPVAYETNLTRALESLQEAGYFAVGLAEEGDDNLGDFAGHEKLVIVLGAEGDGIRRLVREQCDALTRLSTAGPISSLNVSNAAAVALYAISG
jgi:23S rRNA (guanosine2251-2'-O)-methyltransferase